MQVTLTPNGAWGGEGSLGCGIGYGYLHRIPVDMKSGPAPPPSTPPPPMASSHFKADMPNPATMGGSTTTTSHTVMPMVPAMMSPPMVGTMPPPPHAGFQHQFGSRPSASPSPPMGGVMAPPPSEVSSDISSPPSTLTSPTPVAAHVPLFGTGEKFNQSGNSTPTLSPWNASPQQQQQQQQQMPLYGGYDMTGLAPMPPPNLPMPDPAFLAGMPTPPTAPPMMMPVNTSNPLPNFNQLSFSSEQEQHS